MLNTVTSFRGMVTAPHHLAAEAGLGVLRDGGNAIEAMVAAAATIAVVYPHMNSIGGDAFWLIKPPGRPPVGIEACGPAGAAVDIELYRRAGLTEIPSRGPLAANTVAGAVSGWDAALALAGELGGRLPLARVLEPALGYAVDGFPVTQSQTRFTSEKLSELQDCPGFAETYLMQALPPEPGTVFRQERLAGTLQALAQDGLDDFYRGRLARRIAADLERAGSPMGLKDLEVCRASVVQPLSVTLRCGAAYNMPPPSQGLASLMILGLFDHLGVTEVESFELVHGLVEATKQAFLVRDRVVTDPAYATDDAAAFLTSDDLKSRANRIDRRAALPWPQPAGHGDTVWLGAIDASGCAVSYIQSLYWEFGSGVVLEDSGVLWQNRGCSFQLDPAGPNSLRPGRKPFHTLNPALALLGDGREMVYGAMGGDGQPQTQAALFTRYVNFGQGLQQAVTAPRWLLGRTWGAVSTTLKLESRFGPDLVDQLKNAGHIIEIVESFSHLMGHAGALVRHPDGLLEGAADPRSDGQARGF